MREICAYRRSGVESGSRFGCTIRRKKSGASNRNPQPLKIAKGWGILICGGANSRRGGLDLDLNFVGLGVRVRKLLSRPLVPVAGTFLHRCCPHLIMIGDWLEFREQSLGLRLEYRHLVIPPGEFAYGVERIKKVDHYKLRFCRA